MLLCLIHVSACPTCIGRVKEQSAPFFADECYGNSEDEQQSDQEAGENLSGIMLEQFLSPQGEAHER